MLNSVIFLNRSTELQTNLVNSCELVTNFTVDQLKGKWINILSVFNDKLLVSRDGISRLFIYNREGHYLSTIALSNDDQVRDASWTPRGNIVYTTASGSKVVVISESGEIITANTQMTYAQNLSVSKDGVIYLIADRKTGVYQSTDDGASWSLVFKSTEGRHCLQAIKIASTDHSEDFWTLESIGDTFLYTWYLRVYSVDKRCSDGNVTWKDIDLTISDDKQIHLSDNSSLSFDGNENIFLSDYFNKAIYVFSVNGQYRCQLLSSDHIKKEPCKLTIDKDRALLFVGQQQRVVGQFKLLYGKKNDI